MNSEFLARLAEATDSLRKSDITTATRTIQTALRMPNVLGEVKPASSLISGEVNPSTRRLHPSGNVARPRRRLGDTVRIMQSLRGGNPLDLNSLGAPSNRVLLDPLPAGASFTQHLFSCDAGSRSYKLYRPAPDEQAKALVIMLHGCTQNSDDFAVGTGMNRLAHKHGVLVAYPEQASRHNQLKCWNWFNPRDQLRDSGEPSILAGLTREIIAKHNVDPARVYVAGLSSGGAMAATLGVTYPEIFSAVGVHSGLPHEAAYDVLSAFEVMRTGHSSQVHKRPIVEGAESPARIIIFHGDADRTVHPANGFRLFEQAIESDRLSLSERRQGEEKGRGYKMEAASADDGSVKAELWAINGGGHAWSGGDSRGTYADPQGPSASNEMMRFFLQHSH